ncbi:MAG TPA: tetratricopeptide repeat protein, partial [Gemmataceae bacterium]|nr:tetratricopeptide repeat protein [Gemmataceae bacterium]
PVGTAERTWRWCRRNPRMAGLVATVAVLLVAVAGVTSVLSYRLSVRRAEADANARRAEDNARDAAENARQADAARALAVEEQRKAEKARDTTAQQRKLALDTVRDVLIRVDELMKNDVTLAPLRVEIIRRMLEDVDRIRDHAKKNPLEDRTEAIAYTRMGDVYFRTNRIQDSHEWYVKAHAILKGQAEDAPDDPNAVRNLAVAATNLAEAEWRLGRGNRARELHTEALRLREHRAKVLAATNADDFEKSSAAQDVADSLNNVAYADLRLGEPHSAIKHYQLADAAYAGLGPPMAQMLRVRRIRAEIVVRVADARARLGELEKAHEHFVKALSDRLELSRTVVRPAMTASLVRTDVGQSQMYIGDFLLFHKKDARAAGDLYAVCLEGFERELKDDPKSVDLRQRIAASHYRLGIVSGARSELALVTGAAADLAPRGRHHAESLRLREELAKLDPNDAQSGVELLLSQARMRKVDDAKRTADRLLRQAGTDRQVLFQTACGYGILADGDDDEARKFRDEAIRVMKTLVEQGWKDQGGLETDPDLIALKNDKRFADLIARLRAVGDEAN